MPTQEDFEREREGRKRKKVRNQEDFNTDKIYVKAMWKVEKLVDKHRDNQSKLKQKR